MPTLMKPADLAGLNPSTYQKALEKDLARLGRGQKWESFVYITEYKMGAKKTALLVFADAGDKDWDDVIKAAKAKGKKYTTGTCKVAIVPDQDGNGKDDIEITIKEAKGDYNKKKVAESIKEEIFAEDMDVRTGVLAGDGDEDEAIVEEAPHAPEAATTGLDHEKEVLAAKEKLDSFMQAFQDFMAKIGPAQALQAGTQQKLQTLQANQGAPDILKQANAAAHELRIQISDFNEIIEVGQAWFEKHKNKVKDLFGISGYKEKMEAAKERIMNLKRLQRFLTQAEDFIEEKYLHDFAGVDESKLKEEQDKADAQFLDLRMVAASYKKAMAEKAAPKDMFTALTSVTVSLDKYKKFDDSLKTEQQLKFAADVSKHLGGTRTLTEFAVMKGMPELGEFKGQYEDYLKQAEPQSLDECRERLAQVDRFKAVVSDLIERYPVEVSMLVPSIGSEASRIRKIIEKRFKDAKINELIDRAGGRGVATAESLFDAFMEEFRGKAKYTPEEGGDLFLGTPRGNCQDFCNSLGRLFKVCGFDCDTSDVLAQYYLTTPVDGRWLDPTAPGNTNVVSAPAERRYFFSEHWVVKIKDGGQRFCPTTGRKLGDVASTIGEQVGASNKKSFKQGKFSFEEVADKGANRGFLYKANFEA